MKPPMINFSREISSRQIYWRNDPEIYAWTRQNGLISEADQTKWLSKIENDPSIRMFGIIDPFDAKDVEIGTCGLTSISSTHGTAEFSLLIDPSKQGKGFGKAALQKLLRYGFMNLRLNCIWGETFESNPARKMFKSIGMKYEGTHRSRYFKNGIYINSASYSILRNEAERKSWWTL